MALKQLDVRYATKRAKDYKLTDGEGLYLLVRPNDSQLRRMKYRDDRPRPSSEQALFSRRAVRWSMSETMVAQFVTGAL